MFYPFGISSLYYSHRAVTWPLTSEPRPRLSMQTGTGKYVKQMTGRSIGSNHSGNTSPPGIAQDLTRKLLRLLVRFRLEGEAHLWGGNWIESWLQGCSTPAAEEGTVFDSPMSATRHPLEQCDLLAPTCSFVICIWIHCELLWIKSVSENDAIKSPSNLCQGPQEQPDLSRHQRLDWHFQVEHFTIKQK